MKDNTKTFIVVIVWIVLISIAVYAKKLKQQSPDSVRNLGSVYPNTQIDEMLRRQI